MRDKPSFDDIEPPAPSASRLNGLTDAEWAAREARRERIFRAVCGVVFGLVVGTLGVWHWLLAFRTQFAALLVIVGSMLAFALLFAKRRDEEAMGLAGWILLPEWKFVQALPWWAFALAWLVAAALFAVLVGVIAFGRIPFGA